MKITDLIDLGKKALEIFDKYIAENNIEPPKRVFIRHFTTDLEISETRCSERGSSEVVHKPDWSTTVFDFMGKKITPMPEFIQLSQSIAKRYEKNIHKIVKDCKPVRQSAYWLGVFIRRLIHEKLEGTLSDDMLIEYASLFKSELELSASEYRYVHYLDGIFLENDSIRINNNVLIRKTQKDDLEYTQDIFIDISIPKHMDITPTSILEIDISAKDEKDCHEYKNRIFNALRLYKLGSVYSESFTSTKKTMIWPMSQSLGWEKNNYRSFKKYSVKESEVDNFIKFINITEQKLDFNKEERDYRTLFISIERYNSALLESIDIDRKFMTAVMGLESLFTLEKDRGENAFKLGIRVAKLLGNLNFDSVKVRALIEKSYSFRNNVVHGSYISQENRKKMTEMFPHILNYLRVSLIIFLLNQEIGKDKMIEIIDQSTISDIHVQELKKVTEQCTREFGEVLSERML